MLDTLINLQEDNWELRAIQLEIILRAFIESLTANQKLKQ